MWLSWTMVHRLTPLCQGPWKTFARCQTYLGPHGQTSHLHGSGIALTRPIGYVIIQVQVDGVQGYDEDQIALVILDPVILGNPMIGHIMNVIKEMLMTP